MVALLHDNVAEIFRKKSALKEIITSAVVDEVYIDVGEKFGEVFE